MPPGSPLGFVCAKMWVLRHNSFPCAHRMDPEHESLDMYYQHACMIVLLKAGGLILARLVMFWRFCTWQVPVTSDPGQHPDNAEAVHVVALSWPPRPQSLAPSQRRALNDLLSWLRHCFPPRVATVLPQLYPTVYLVDRPGRSLRQSKITAFLIS